MSKNMNSLLKNPSLKAPKLAPAPYQPLFDDKLRKSTMDAPYTQRVAY